MFQCWTGSARWWVLCRLYHEFEMVCSVQYIVKYTKIQIYIKSLLVLEIYREQQTIIYTSHTFNPTKFSEEQWVNTEWKRKGHKPLQICKMDEGHFWKSVYQTWLVGLEDLESLLLIWHILHLLIENQVCHRIQKPRKHSREKKIWYMYIFFIWKHHWTDLIVDGVWEYSKVCIKLSH